MRLFGRLIPLLPLLLAAPLAAAQEDAASAIRESNLQTHVAYLAADTLEGRNSGYPGNATAAQYIADQFLAYGVTPAGDSGTFLQNFSFEYDPKLYDPASTDPVVNIATSNVVGLLPGTSAETIVLGAHFDHVGKGGQRFPGGRPPSDTDDLYNGADDNASGVAALLEIARALRETRTSLRRNVLLIAFGGEEYGLYGSKYYVDHPRGRIEDHTAMINLDMIGRKGRGVCWIYGFKSDSAWLDRLIRVLTRCAMQNEVYPIWPVPYDAENSDQSAFHDKKIPYLFLTTGTHLDWHGVDDEADRIDSAVLNVITRMTARMIVTLANDSARPAWQDPPAERKKIGLTFWDVEPAEGALAGVPKGQGGLRVLEVVKPRKGEKVIPVGYAAGARLDDIIIGFNYNTFTPGGAYAEMLAMLWDVPANQEVPLIVVRKGKQLRLNCIWKE